VERKPNVAKVPLPQGTSVVEYLPHHPPLWPSSTEADALNPAQLKSVLSRWPSGPSWASMGSEARIQAMFHLGLMPTGARVTCTMSNGVSAIATYISHQRAQAVGGASEM
jgi:hypothetical protein